MKNYEEQVLMELIKWQQKMIKKPSVASKLTKGLQKKVNDIIPEKMHNIITAAIKNMVEAVLTGSKFLSREPIKEGLAIEEREKLVLDKKNFYQTAAATSGAGTGAGGILLGLADFPVLLSLKIKFLFDTAGLYGFDVRDFRERLYILYIFELAFSSQEKRNQVYKQIFDWNKNFDSLPLNMDDFDWRGFQQEYRDYIDLAKMLQLVPGIGAVVGAYANYRFMDKLAETAMNAYRLRLLRK